MAPLFPGLLAAEDIHPLFVHFPVALWPTAAAFFAYGVLRDHEGALQTGRWLAYVGLAGAAAALATGFLAADRLGHDSPGHEHVHVHRNLMLGASVLVAAAAAAARLAATRVSKKLQSVALGLLLAGVAVTALGADRGARLVFEFGLGVSQPVPATAPAGPHHGGGEHGHHGGHAH